VNYPKTPRQCGLFAPLFAAVFAMAKHGARKCLANFGRAGEWIFKGYLRGAQGMLTVMPRDLVQFIFMDVNILLHVAHVFFIAGEEKMDLVD